MLKTIKIKCPRCWDKLEIDEYTETGDSISCPHCYSDIEVVSLDPPKLVKAEKSRYDDDEDYSYDDEEESLDDEDESEDDFEYEDEREDYD
ncbi:MAG: hypothetical protein JW928_08605 [Candidatus Aureabacteria bacterium]|nr:hypothetical protein [Candidatus Auribacterota bacterium]